MYVYRCYIVFWGCEKFVPATVPCSLWPSNRSNPAPATMPCLFRGFGSSRWCMQCRALLCELCFRRQKPCSRRSPTNIWGRVRRVFSPQCGLADHAAAGLPCVFWIQRLVMEAAGLFLIGLLGFRVEGCWVPDQCLRAVYASMQ